jgi:hypothetical protein
MRGNMNAPQPDAESVRAASCQKAFRMMMWALVFFVPVPVGDLLFFVPAPIPNVFPDVIGWILFLIAIQMVPRLHPAVGPMRLLAAFGLALWVGRTIAFHSTQAETQNLYLLLYLSTWAVLMLVVWKACAIIAHLAAAAKADSVAQAARWRRWLCVLPFASFALAANFQERVPPAAAFLFMFMVACVLGLLMGLMAHTARMCALTAQTQPAGTESGKQAN